MFLHFWLLGRRSFSIFQPFCLLIGRPIAGCACFFWAFGCSVGAPLWFACVFASLLTARLQVVHFFGAFACSVCAPLVFPCLLLVYWPHFCWLCMFLRIWLHGRCYFNVSLPLCLVIGWTFACWACFCTFGCWVGTPLALPYRFTCLFAAHLLVGPVFAHLIDR